MDSEQALFELRRDGAEIGEFDAETIRRMLEAEMLAQDDFFRPAGERAWKPMLMFDEQVPENTVRLGRDRILQKSEPVAEASACVGPQAVVNQVLPTNEAQVPKSRKVWWIAGSTIAVLVIAAGVFFATRSGSDSADGDVQGSRVGERFRADAEAGDAFAQALLADALLFEGIPDEAAYKESADWAEKSSKQGAALGTTILAEAYLRGRGRVMDWEKGGKLGSNCSRELVAQALKEDAHPVLLRWASGDASSFYRPPGVLRLQNYGNDFGSMDLRLLVRAVLAGDRQAVVIASGRSQKLSPDGGETTIELADVIAKLREAADAGYLPAMHRLAEYHLFGRGSIEEDVEEAERLLREAGEAGWPESWVKLAKLYHSEALPRGEEKVRECLGRAKEVPKARIGKNMFVDLQTGDDLPLDPDLAEEWLATLPDWAKADAISEWIVALLRPGRPPEFAAAEKWLGRLKALDDIPPTSLSDLSEAAARLCRGDVFRKDPTPGDPQQGLAWFEKLIALGDTSAYQKMAELYQSGRHLPKDLAKAKTYFGKHAEADGSSHSQWRYGQILQATGELEGAIEWYRKAAEGGAESAMHSLADLFALGEGVEKDQERATSYHRMAAEDGGFGSAAILCWRLENDLGKEKEVGEVAKWRKMMDRSLEWQGEGVARSAKLRDTASLFENEPQKDPAEAMRWFLRAADEGDESSIEHVAFNTLENAPEEQQVASARYLRKFADEEDPMGMYLLGLRYAEGRGVEQDKAEAARWIEKAAKLGDLLAIVDLGMRYATGEGVEQSDVMAFRWLKKGAEGGNPMAMMAVGTCFAAGKGVEKSGELARFWHQRAALRGQDESMLRMGTIYIMGDLVTPDLTTAYAWFTFAINEGATQETRDQATRYRAKLDENFSAEQIAAGRRLEQSIQRAKVDTAEE